MGNPKDRNNGQSAAEQMNVFVNTPPLYGGKYEYKNFVRRV